MQQKRKYTLGKNERLKSRKAIDALFATGKSFSLFPFRIVYILHKNESQPTETTVLQCAFSVSKRNFKKATARNRIKRLMREAWRLQKNDWQQQLEQTDTVAQVFLLYVGTEMPEYAIVFSKIGTALTRLQKTTNEKMDADR